ncbi:MAG: HAMP domain-containing sensor histidine kinase [Pseudomonadota bacterium]
MRFPNSLATRLMIAVAIWTAIALTVTGTLLSSANRTNVENGFEDLLRAYADNLIGAIVLAPNGDVQAEPKFGDPRFATPGSGWYWLVAKANEPNKPLVFSASLSGAEIAMPSSSEEPFDEAFIRSYTIVENGQEVQRYESQLFLESEQNTLFQVTVAGNRDAISAPVEEFSQRIWGFFILFGVGTILVMLVAIRLGLRPVVRATRRLTAIRNGKQSYMETDYPTEILPLAGEIDALIDANRSVMERARTQVGNLAHALKTPLAVILNESRSPAEGSLEIAAEQAELMSVQVQNYLNKARISAQRQVSVSRCDSKAVAEQLIAVMRKLNPEVNFTLRAKDPVAELRTDEHDLQEMLGNLLENAARFAKKDVKLSISGTAAGKQLITVEDDGEGLSKEECAQALKRGERIDETTEGSGLGLSIVRDTAIEYGGSVELDKSPDLGGLRVKVVLPAVL